MSRIFTTSIFYGAAFSCLAFSVAPQKRYLSEQVKHFATWLFNVPFNIKCAVVNGFVQ